ncbi:MAG: anti-anti-sigma factor [Phycisphaerales bacterium]|jgi:anti-anti-sigma factor
MAIEWSDNILLANLIDEPALSDELTLIGDQIEEAPAKPHAVLDFRDVSYINSSNIAQLLRLRKILDAANRELRLCGVADEVWSVLLVTGLDKVFHFSPDTLTALASLQIAGNENPEA